MATATYLGAQTERRGGAGTVRGLLGGKDLTGRFFFIAQPELAYANYAGASYGSGLLTRFHLT
jgi:hypothetical protein